MLSGKRFKISRETIAIETQADGRRVAIHVPQGEIVKVISGPRPDDKRMVDILWDGRTLVIFADDIQLRGEEVKAAEKP